MRRALPLLAALLSGVAWGAAPFYSATSIVQTGNSAPGPFAPNSIVTIYGTDLSRSSAELTAADIRDNRLPVELNYTRVMVDNIPVPLYYVSETQVNFLIPSRQGLGECKVRVARQGLTGPEVTIRVVEAAPALFALDSGYAIATHTDFTPVSADSRARPGEVIVLWATGLGKTVANPQTGELPPYISPIVLLNDLQVLVAGAPIDPRNVIYAGLTPGFAGLYQINLRLPDKLPEDPEIRVSLAGQITPAGLKLAVR